MLQEKLDNLLNAILDWSPKFIGALLVLVIGLWIANKLLGIFKSMLAKSNLSEEIRPFLLSLVSITLKLGVILFAAGIVGVETSSFVAMLAALGFAVGMALQGSLGHIAAGILILLFKPYKVGDFITIGDYKGFVTGVHIINTILRTLDNETVIIPNGSAISDVIVNSSDEDGMIRLQIPVYMPYGESFPKVESLLHEALLDCQYVQKEPKPMIGIATFDTHSIVVDVKPYALVEEYELAYFEVTKAIKYALSKNNIQVAYSEGIELGNIGI
jgi:small conductance mechanosensitive channel